MGIENAKLVAIPIKTIPKERVLEEIKRILGPVFEIVTSAVCNDYKFIIPVVISSAEDGECLVGKLLEDGGEHTQIKVPSEEDVKALVKTELEDRLWDPDGDVEYRVYRDFDGDFFELVVTFSSVEHETVGPIDRGKMADKLSELIHNGAL